jgi:hypothetical protein
MEQKRDKMQKKSYRTPTLKVKKIELGVYGDYHDPPTDPTPGLDKHNNL